MNRKLTRHVSAMAISPMAVLVLAAGAISSASALNIVDNKLVIYGTLHPSLDYLDSGVSAEEAKTSTTDKLSSGDVSLSFNSSYIGFKGEFPTDVPGLTAFYQVEQNLNPDGGSSDTLSTRNTFAGLRGTSEQEPQWELLAGRYDSMAKSVALDYTLLKHTVADRGAILGAGANSGNKMDLRVENMLLGRWYTSLAGGNLRWSAQYSPDAIKSSGYVDNNQRLYVGTGLDWHYQALTLAAGMDHWQQLTIGSKTGDADFWRVMARYKTAQMTLVSLFENIRYQPDDHSVTDLDRKAMALQASWSSGKLTWIGSVMKAGDYRHGDDTSALMTSVGLERSLSKSLKTYAVYTRTANADQAAFQGVDGTHGDELGSVAGGTPKAFSIGMQMTF
jgi:predicted porin